ncbi:hypothetical protein M9H77_26798 [Catharanthus roseus]|uniref:Uncharacterized protein n=1 Tax=Catharanthus roseus TaxID=4058 RepID=A0ACC0AC94_CATRO|nr:hypothetical protein M9H77_26798 [Catharanthus roseus]
MSDSRPSNHADKAMSESSQNRQFDFIRETIPRLEQATHKIMENFMIKMMKLLEAWAEEALKRFLKFRPPEFYGEVEQETKAELFLEQVSDIYDTFKHEDALRVTFAAFRLRRMMSKRAGRPPAMSGATEGRSDKPQVKAKVYALDGLPVDTEAEVVEGMIQIFSQLARALIDPGAMHFFFEFAFYKTHSYT